MSDAGVLIVNEDSDNGVRISAPNQASGILLSAGECLRFPMISPNRIIIERSGDSDVQVSCFSPGFGVDQVPDDESVPTYPETPETVPLTVDRTDITVDSTLISADQTII